MFAPFRRWRALVVTALFAALIAAGLPAKASAAALWMLTGMPITAEVNQATTFTLTATNLDLLNDIGCIQVDVTSAFAVQSTGVPVASE